MKKYLLIFFLVFSCVGFSQTVTNSLTKIDTSNITASKIATGFLKYTDFSAFMNKVGVTNAEVSTSINYSILTTDHFIDCTGGSLGITVTLPTAVGYSGFTVSITKVDNGIGNITIATSNSQTINGNLTLVISSQYVSYTLHSNGANWVIN